MNFEDFDLLELMPQFMRKDKFVVASCKALNPWIKQLYKDAGLAFIYGMIDTLEEEIIDILLKDFHVDYYDYTMSIEKKRELVKKSLELHRRKGTAFAVEEACKVFGKTKVKEWFEYGDDPYYFSGDIDITDVGATEENFIKIERLIYIFKNIRSHLRKLNIYMSNYGKIYYASAAVCGEEVSVYPYSEDNIEVSNKIFVSSTLLSEETIVSYPEKKGV